MRRFATGVLVIVLGAAAHAEGPAMVDLVPGNNQFALDLAARLRAQPGNLFVSPYSLSAALAMTYVGAGGETAAQMAKTLHFSLPPDRLHPAFATLNAALVDDAGTRRFTLHVANALWGQEGEPFLPAFLEQTRDCFGAGLHTVDFRAAGSARRTINAWVESQTREKIRDLISPEALGPDTKLVLTNAIYFKAAWARPFPEDATREERFRVAGEPGIPVPMMHLTDDFAYFDGGRFAALELPYEGHELGMVVILPKAAEGLDSLESSLRVDWLTRMQRRKVSVSLPRFRIERAVALQAVLASLGMPDAFGAGADFSGINGKRDLFLSAVLHKAFVDVNEAGTEAAAATAVMMARSQALRPTPPVVFRADHPFLFLIRHNKTGQILFFGRVVNPLE